MCFHFLSLFSDLQEPKEPLAAEAIEVKRMFFATSTVETICKSLVGKYLPLSQEDLELWDADPEEYGALLNLLTFLCGVNHSESLFTPSL